MIIYQVEICLLQIYAEFSTKHWHSDLDFVDQCYIGYKITNWSGGGSGKICAFQYANNSRLSNFGLALGRVSFLLKSNISPPPMACQRGYI